MILSFFEFPSGTVSAWVWPREQRFKPKADFANGDFENVRSHRQWSTVSIRAQWQAKRDGHLAPSSLGFLKRLTATRALRDAYPSARESTQVHSQATLQLVSKPPTWSQAVEICEGW